jgi:hypothetical protein
VLLKYRGIFIIEGERYAARVELGAGAGS